MTIRQPAVIASMMLTLAAAGVLAPRPARAQQNVDSGAIGAIDTRQGLSNNSAFTLLQDHQGFMWVGTIDGLNRFDGVSFATFRHDPDVPGSLANNTVRRLWEDGDRNLWIRTAAGIDRLERGAGVFHHYSLQAQAFAQDAQGRLLVAAPQGLFRYLAEDDRFEPVAALPWAESDPAPFAEDPVWRILYDSQDRTWLSTERGRLYRVDADGGVTRTQSPWARALVEFEDETGRLWVGHTRGVGTFDPADSQFGDAPGAEHITASVLPMLRDRAGTIWVGADRLYRILPGETAQSMVIESTAPEPLSTRFWDITQDQEGAIWLATAAGLVRLDPFAKPFRNFVHNPTDPASPGAGPVVSVASDDGNLWIGTIGGGLTRLDLTTGDAHRYAELPGADSLCGSEVWAVHSGPGEQTWMGTDRGLCALDANTGRFALVALAVDSASSEPAVFAVTHDLSGQVWAGTSSGLFRIDAATHAAVRVKGIAEDRPEQPGVAGLAVTGDGSLWVGTSGSDLYHLDPTTLRTTRFALGDARALRGSEGFWAIAECGDGNLWLGSDRGLFVFDPASGELSEAELTRSLPAAPAYALVHDNDGALWVSTNNGLLRFQHPLDPNSSSVARRYTTGDGLPHAEFNRRAAARLSDGRLAFGSLAGTTVLDPQRLLDNPHPPPVVITSIERLRREGAVTIDPYGRQSLRLPHDDTGLTFEFTALTFSDPERTAYAYRLDNFDPQWVQAGAQRQARYPALAPGTYRFHVRAANADGVWNREGVSIAIDVPPPWWATLWFRLLAASGLFTALALTIRQVSTRALRRRVRDLELARQIHLERERISRDLHDNIGARVSTILAGVELAQLTAGSGNREDVDDHLVTLRAEAQRAMDQLHETVWSLNREQVTVGELADQIHEHLHEQQQLRDKPSLRCEAAGDRRAVLSSGHALEIFRLIQEAVQNAIRYADAHHVQVRLLTDAADSLHVEIRDDGAFRQPPPGHQGFGLAGMRIRAEQIGGNFSLESETAGGTAIRVVLPLPPMRRS